MTIVIGILFFIFASREVLFWVSLWQLKEYRLDRLWVHIRDTQQGKKALLSSETVLLTLLLLTYSAVLFWEQLASFYVYAIFLFLIFELYITAKKAMRHVLKRPVYTVKSLCITFLSLVTVSVLLLFPLVDFSLWIICLGFLLPLFVAFFVFLFSFPTEIYTDLYLQKAKRKRDSLKNLVVIAVSGSYGKSSTKEIIAHLLSQKYNVEKTLLSQNTPLAVAGTLLKKVSAKTDFLIAELGAYKKGEIDQMARVVKPTIGVTTAISDQHFALYGGMNEVVESEMELIHAIPKKSFVLFNENSKNMPLLAKQTTRKIFWYKTSVRLNRQKDNITAYDIKPSPEGVSFQVAFDGKHFAVHSPLLGTHTVENILPAIFLAMHFGLSEQEITTAIQSLKPLPKTMEKKNILPGITVVDDTFNESPESIAAAVEYLKLFPNRKILVMSPLIELGKMARKRHEEVGELLAAVDIVLLTNKNFLDDIKVGIKQKNGKTLVICDSYKALTAYIKQNCQKRDAIIFEGKEAGIVLQQL